MVVGYLDGAPDAVAGARAPRRARRRTPRPSCTAAGSLARYAKHHLPNYGVFDEFRYFVPGASLTVARVHGVDVAIVICEDIWQDGGPVATVREAGAGLLLVINGSPYERNKDDVRLELVQRRAADAGCALAYVNMVGGQDELVFDGDSLVVDADGERARAGAAVRRASCSSSTSTCPPHRTAARPHRCAAGARRPRRRIGDQPTVVPRTAAPQSGAGIAPSASRTRRRSTRALVTGLRDYVRKNGFQSVVHRPLRRHRLGTDRGHRLRRARRGQRARRLDAEQLLVGALQVRRRRPRRAHRAALPRPCRSRRWSTRSSAPLDADRSRRGEPAGPGARHRS